MNSAEEQAVLNYLATAPNVYFSGREICRRASDKQTWEKNPRWALPLLARLVSRQLVETDAAGHYRIARPAD